MCILCMFRLIGSWEGRKNLRVGIFLNKKLVRVGLQETNNFFRPNILCVYVSPKCRLILRVLDTALFKLASFTQPLQSLY